MRTLRTTRRLPKETLEVERFDSLDGQGLPTYDTAIDFEANVLEYDVGMTGRGAQFVVDSSGSRVDTPLTLYVDGREVNVPNEKDRVRMDGTEFIVAEKTPLRGLRNRREEPDHYRLRCRKE